jgi:hypothetical protein
VEVSRYRLLSVAWTSLLAILCCVAFAAALGDWGWRRFAEFGTGLGIAFLVDWLFRWRGVLKKLADAQPLPIGAVDVSDSDREILTLYVSLLVGFVGAGVLMALLFHDDTARTLWLVAGVVAGYAVAAVRDSRMLARWEASNGRVFVARKRGAGRKQSLYIEDPAAAPFDAR